MKYESDEAAPYLVEGSFGGGITDWLDGQVVYRNDDAEESINTNSGAKYSDMTPTSRLSMRP